MDLGPTFEFAGEHRLFAHKYRPTRVLGRGGMGLVFEARHARLDVPVAIKLLYDDLRGHGELVTRFEREAAVAGSLTSAHAVKVFDYDVTDDGRPFIVMERLQGEDLGALLERCGPQEPARVAAWVLEACDAIVEAHDRGIIHRDIKPSNLFLAEANGEAIVKVVDFGIAKRQGHGPAITQHVAPLGTPQYMAPEQIRSAATADQRADVWSLGITLYELVTGRTPFADRESSVAIIAATVSDPIPDARTFKPELSADFAAVLIKALAKNPADRYPTVRDLMQALAPFVADRVVAPPAPPRERVISYEAIVVPQPAAELARRSNRAPSRTWGYAAVALTLAIGVAHAAASVPKRTATPPVVDPPAEAASLSGSIAPATAAVVPPADAPVIATDAPVIATDAPVIATADAPVIELPAETAAEEPANVTPSKGTSARRPRGESRAKATGEARATATRDSAAHGGLSGPGF